MNRVMMKALLGSVSFFALVTALATPSAAQSIEGSPSVLERVLGNITSSGTTISGGDIGALYANVAATSLSILVQDPAQIATLDDVMGNIDARVRVSFLSTSGQPLLAEALTTDALAREWQPMQSSLGDLSTTGIGAVLDDSASITIGAVQTVEDSIAGMAMAVSQSTEPLNAIALNAAVNSASINASVILDVADVAVDAGDIATTAIGAVGGGTIVAGNVDRLNRTVSSFVGSSD